MMMVVVVMTSFIIITRPIIVKTCRQYLNDLLQQCITAHIYPTVLGLIGGVHQLVVHTTLHATNRASI